MTALSKGSITRRVRALGQVAKRCGGDASTLVGTVLRLWCNRVFPALPVPSLPYCEVIASTPEVSAFVDVLCQLRFLESTYWLSSSYAIHSDENYRKRLQQRPEVARAEAGQLVDGWHGWEDAQ